LGSSADDSLPEWAVSGGRSLDDNAFGVAVDTEGNSYIAGNYDRAKTYGEAPAPIGPAPSHSEVFVLKVNYFSYLLLNQFCCAYSLREDLCYAALFHLFAMRLPHEVFAMPDGFT
jgi:hypothetical protein